MTITAKFASRCGSCGQPVTPGQKIEWTKGAPVRHTVCGGSTPTNVVKVTPAAAGRGGRSNQSDPDMYTDRRTGETLMRGCGQCRRLGRMCKSCEFDEYDN